MCSRDDDGLQRVVSVVKRDSVVTQVAVGLLSI